ncbi:MAG: glycosyltransferase family 4 protein [Candidatus Asgardarchaeia archaeon]
MEILAQNWRDIKNPEAGGADFYIHEILRSLAKKGHNITLISSRFNGCKNIEIIDGIKIIRIGNKFLFNFLFIWYFFKKLRKYNYDFFIDNNSKIPLCTPMYVKVPMLTIIHHIHGKSLFKELIFPLALYVYVMEKLLVMYRKVKIIAVSSSTKKELIRIFKIPSNNIHVIPPGINIKPRIEKKAEYPLIVYFGRVKKYKRIDHIIKAFKFIEEKYPNAKLVIAGKGDNYPALMKLTNKLRIKNIEFMGEITETDKEQLLKEAWVYVITSLKEGWGITVIEANAFGTPCIAYNVPGLRDSIKHNYNGLLVRNGDITSLQLAIEKIIVDNNLRKRLSINAVKWAKKFTWDRTTSKFEKILNLVIKNIKN